jgi:hypothetical protein
MPKHYTPLATRLWTRVRVSSGCWEWQGPRNLKGYGSIGVWGKGSTMPAHRAAWILTNGFIPAGLHVLHRCDNPPCCNPDHLFLGTNADNVADKMVKGRQPSIAGERNPRARLTLRQVVALRSKYAEGGVSQSALAREYGVSVSAIGFAITGRSWAHV